MPPRRAPTGRTGDPRFEIRPLRAGPSPDCLTRGSSPRYATSLRLVRNRLGFPTAAMNEAAQIRFTPGTVISRRISGQDSACWAISFSSRGDLSVEELDVTDTGVDRLALLQRQLQSREPLTALDPEQVRARRLALKPPLQHRVDLILRAGTGAHQLLAASQPAAQDPAALIRHPHRLKLTLPQQAGQRPSVQLVGLRSRAGDPSVVR